MTMIRVTAYENPKSIEEATTFLAKDTYVPIAGGTDVILELRNGMPVKLLDINNLKLNHVTSNKDNIEIGAACTHTQLASNPIVSQFVPLVGIAAGKVGSKQIRNRGTIGGNIVNASPCADTIPALLIYDAELVLLSKKGRRIARLDEFITSPYATIKRNDELLHSIICKKNNKTGYSYLKLGRRQAVNISRMTISVALDIDDDNAVIDACISAGSVFPVPSRMKDLEKFLRGEKIKPKLFKEAGKLAVDLMIKHSGYRWSTPYKEPVLAGLIERALMQASKGIVQDN
ncbi:MAG: xanthine dehydrogenase family protein subunit M [candidate division Zixibacteria bacterium]|nr:xanthine dehydrogenase family protein subunit M [candidate division Zixibacteria bacterium]